MAEENRKDQFGQRQQDGSQSGPNRGSTGGRDQGQQRSDRDEQGISRGPNRDEDLSKRSGQNEDEHGRMDSDEDSVR